MGSSVNLQEPLSYVVWPIVLTGVITAAVLLFFGVCWYLRRRRKMAAELPKVVKPAPMDMGRVKAEYSVRTGGYCGTGMIRENLM